MRTAFDDEVLRLTGARLKETRQKRGLRLDDVAHAMNVSQSVIYNAEVGQACSLAMLHRFAEYFDLTLDDLSPIVTEAG
jgi:transcriptional regulator with XRE-family HTH domain